MSSSDEPSRISSTLSNLAGKAKEAVGNVVGSERMKQEGEGQQHLASAEYAAAQSQSKEEGGKERLEGTMKEATSGSGERQDLEGKWEQTKGAAKQEFGNH